MNSIAMTEQIMEGSINMKAKAIVVLLILINSLLFANDLIPGKAQENPIILKNGTLFTVSGDIIQNGSILFEDGKITAIGKDISIPENAEIIDLKGKNVYPGLIAPVSQMGLVEISAVRASVDQNEVGQFNPNVRADIAYNPDSEIIPTVRSNGITTALISPVGGLVSGISSIMHMDGWTREDITLVSRAAVTVNWPRMTVINTWWMRTPAEKQKESITKNLRQIKEYFETAKAYHNARKNNPDTEIDIRFEALRPVWDKQLPVIISADELKQIEAAVEFARYFDIKMILESGADAWKVTYLLKENNIPVLLRHTHNLPSREDEDYDIAYKTPYLLDQAGIKFAFMVNGSWQNRNLPFYAGSAVAHGLSKESALKALTLWPAEILGFEEHEGSLEVGKDATLIVSSGDIMDYGSSNVEYMFIQGRKVDLDNRHKRLYRKYSERYK